MFLFLFLVCLFLFGVLVVAPIKDEILYNKVKLVHVKTLRQANNKTYFSFSKQVLFFLKQAMDLKYI